jgi:hypothetical protein
MAVFARAAIGASLLFTFWLLLFSYDKYFPRSNRWSADNPSSWMVASLFYGDWGLTIGSVAGVMARRKKEID